MTMLRLSIIGFGTVGQGLAELLLTKKGLLRQKYDLGIHLVGVATAHSGFIYREAGLDIPTLLELAAAKRPLTEHPGVTHWQDIHEGLQATDFDILAEASPTNLRDAEPAISYISSALSRRIHVVTANKGPCALAANELYALAEQNGAYLRMESTVMAGTPVISTIREGMAGANILALRGILNGTTNYILTSMASGRGYAEALADAQAQGYAETDPTADVEGYDTLAKTLILAALVFGHTLKPEQVARQGITAITKEQVRDAIDQDKRIKLVASLRLLPGNDQKETTLEARVEPLALPLSDPLARVDGVLNALTIQADTLSEVTIIGPGAGPLQTGQGLLADIIACAYN